MSTLLFAEKEDRLIQINLPLMELNSEFLQTLSHVPHIWVKSFFVTPLLFIIFHLSSKTRESERLQGVTKSFKKSFHQSISSWNVRMPWKFRISFKEPLIFFIFIFPFVLCLFLDKKSTALDIWKIQSCTLYLTSLFHCISFFVISFFRNEKKSLFLKCENDVKIQTN